MEPIEYERMYHAENQHWWYLGMASIPCVILNQYFYQTKNLNILYAGCGTGAAMSTYLKDYGKVTGFDISPLALAKRLLESIWPPNPDASELNFSSEGLNSLFRRILGSEAPLATRMGLPFGLSVVALG